MMKIEKKSKYTFKEEISSKDYFKFLKDNNANFFNTEEYGILKNSYGATCHLVGIVDSSEKLISAGLLVFYKSKKIKNLYCPRGPIIDYYNKDLIKTFLDGVYELAKKLKADTIDIEPNSIVRRYTSKLDVTSEDDKIIECFEQNGYKHQGYTGQIPHFQLRYTVLFDLKKEYEYFFKSYASDKKKVINRNDKYLKVNIEESDSSNLSDIVKFREQLSNKKRFHVEDITYFEKLYALYQENHQVLFLRAIIDFEITLTSIKQELDKLNVELTNTKNNRDIENKINSLEQKKEEITVFRKNHNNIQKYSLGAGIAIIVNGNMTYLYEHTDKEIGNFGVPTLMTDYLINYGVKNNLKTLDLLGLINPNYENNPNKSVNNFKMTFGGDIVEYIGVFSKPVSKFYKVKKTAKRMYYKFNNLIYED